MLPSPQRFGQREIILLFVVVGLTFVAFLPMLQNQFTNWDDPDFILENSSVMTMDWPHIKDSFRTVYVNVYCPLTVLSWALENHFFGLDPFIFHLDNLLLHLWVTACVFFLALRLGLPLYAAGLAALLFGVHPMHVESVSWATERKDVLFASFYVPALITYWSYLKKGRPKSYCLSLAFGLLSILSKVSALSLPIVLFVLDWMAQRKFDKRVFLDKIPYFLFIVPITLMTFFHHTDMKESLPGDHLGEAISIFFWSFSFYIQKFLWPFNVIPYYQLPEPIGLTHWPYVVATIIFVVCVALFIYYRRNRWFMFASLFFIASIFFLLRYGAVVRYTSVVADRHIYIPSIGFCLFFGWFFYSGFQRLRPRGVMGKTAAVLVVALLYVSFAVKTFFLTQIWKDSISFWTYVIKMNPQFVAKAYCLRGYAYVEKEEWDLALKDANATLAVNPNAENALNVRGIVYSHQGKDYLALDEFNQAIKSNPRELISYINRADVYAALGQFDDAIADANKAMELQPDHAKAYGMRGKAFGLKGDFEHAFADLDRSIYLNPKNPLTYYDRGFFQSQLGHHELAVADFSKALSLKPDDFITLDQRGAVYYATGQYDLAQQDFDAVLKLNPSYARGFNNRGSNYMAKDQYDLALADFNNALSLDPDYATAYMNRSLILQQQQQWAKALEDALKAQSLGYPLEEADIKRLKEKVPGGSHE